MRAYLLAVVIALAMLFGLLYVTDAQAQTSCAQATIVTVQLP